MLLKEYQREDRRKMRRRIFQVGKKKSEERKTNIKEKINLC